MQVTLQILRALIDKSPRDLSLYAPYVMGILTLVLRAKDLNMVEDSISTFETFCAHHDVTTMAADQNYFRQYEDIVRLYANFATDTPMTLAKSPLSTPMAIRWRSAGLRAVKSATSSDALNANGGRQLSIAIPTILHNIYSESEDYLVLLQEKAYITEKSEKETIGLRRKMSVSTVKTADGSPDTNPAVVSGTIADADRVAEEEVSLLALQSLQQIFTVNNRSQMRMATMEILRFTSSKITQKRLGAAEMLKGIRHWATSLMEMVTRWAPVQDRFVILVTVMESLVRSPVVEGNLEQQLVLVALVRSLLRSSINMIGLSVMDVLLGLVQHILLLLQLGGTGSNVLPHHQQVDAIDLFKDSKEYLPQTMNAAEPDVSLEGSSPSVIRQELLIGLRSCIGDLASHIYYSDQISDMIAAILLRLKPSPLSGIKSTAAAIEHPAAAAQAISDSVNLQEDSRTDDFFSFETARVTALHAIRDILTVANMKGSVTGAGAIGRNRVGVQVWEGTQWLLRDEDRRVRRAYVETLLTWLRVELSKGDLRIVNDHRSMSGINGKASGDAERTASLTKRAVSNASQRSKQPAKSTFLQLLHLAIYDNALESSGSDSEILLLHLLLTNLVERLGVHAVKAGLPMILRLQEDINVDKLVQTPLAKINVGSLVHGYFWILSDNFDLDTTLVGYEIHSEISRRKKHELWNEGIRIPPLPLDHIIPTSMVPLVERRLSPMLLKESLKPFDASPSLVNHIAQSYASSIASPPTSPPTSPSRVFTTPILTSASAPFSKNEFPKAFKEAMLSTWTKESCIATMEKESFRTLSLNGSRNGTNRSTRQNHLAVNGHQLGDDSPTGINTPGQLHVTKRHNSDAEEQVSATALTSAILPLQQERLRHSSVQDTGSPTPVSSSDRQPTLRIDDLKRALAGGALSEAFARGNTNSAVRNGSPLRNTSTAYQDFADSPVGRTGMQSLSSGSNSVVSANGFESVSEGGSNHPIPPPQAPLGSSALADVYSQEVGRPSFDHSPSPARIQSRSSSREPSRLRPQSSSSASEDPEANAKALKGELIRPLSRGSGGDGDDDVPPVPPLPPSISMHNNVGFTDRRSIGDSHNENLDKPPAGSDMPNKRSERDGSLHGVGDTGSSMTSGRREHRKTLDIRQLLIGIEVGDSGLGRGVGKPPY